MVHWALPPKQAPPPWFSLENTLRSPVPVMRPLTTKLSPDAQTHPILYFLQEVLKKVSLLLNFSSYLHTEASICLTHRLCIDKSPFLWRLWIQKGILVLGDLYEWGCP
ncbi:hypothetical protein XENORESO_006032 [Xenotaenia resolanae]|uniref:Uncharacterized protein n=1 Tax=Xenotaenia resolanae TaxID=208358 RepID=A0ABV0X704_9TELE